MKENSQAKSIIFFMFLLGICLIPMAQTLDWGLLDNTIWCEPDNGPPGTTVTIKGDMAGKPSGDLSFQLWILETNTPVTGSVSYKTDTFLEGWAKIPEDLGPGKIQVSILLNGIETAQIGVFEFTVTSRGLPDWMIQGGAVAAGAGVLAIGSKLLGGRRTPRVKNPPKKTAPRTRPIRQVSPPRPVAPRRLPPQKPDSPVHFCLNCGARLVGGVCPECGRPLGPAKSELERIDEVADSVEHSMIGDGMENVVSPLQKLKTVAVDAPGMVVGKIASDITQEQMRLGGLSKAMKDVVFKRKITKFKKVAKAWNKVKKVMKTLKKPLQILDLSSKVYSGVKGYNKYLEDNKDFIKDNLYLGRMLGAVKATGDEVIKTLLTKNPMVGIADTVVDVVTGGRVQPIGQTVDYVESLVDEGSYAAMYKYHSHDAMKNVARIPNQRIKQMIDKLNDAEYVRERGLSPEKVNTLREKYTNMLVEA